MATSLNWLGILMVTGLTPNAGMRYETAKYLETIASFLKNCRIVKKASYSCLLVGPGSSVPSPVILIPVPSSWSPVPRP